MLLRCLSRDGDNLLLELTNVQVKQRLEREVVLVDVEVLLDELLHFIAMLLLHLVIAESLDNRHSFFELLDHFLECLLDLIRI